MGLFSLFGGGDDGTGAANTASAAQVAAAQQAGAAQQGYLQKGLDLQTQQYGIGKNDLNSYYNDAKSGLAPYALGGYNAYDTYLGTLGQATPTGGSFALSQGLDQGGKIQQQIDNFKPTEDAEYRNKLLALVRSRTDVGDNKMQPWGSQNITGQNFEASSNEGLYNILQQWAQDAKRMVQTGSTIDPTPVAFRRNQVDQLNGWLGQLNAAGLANPEQAAAASAAAKAKDEETLAKLKSDPNYLKYLDYQQGKVGMTGADSSGALSKFFNTPEYQLQFGNSGSAVDPNANPQDRFKESPGYQFQLDQGRQQLEKSAASRGLLESGSFAKELNNFGQGVANQEWNNYLGRVTGTFQNYQNQLSALASGGAQTSGVLANMAIGQGSNLASLGANYANQGSNIYGAMGTGAANSLLAQGQAQAAGAINGYNLSSANSQANGKLGSALGTAAGTYFGGSAGGSIGGALGGIAGGLF